MKLLRALNLVGTGAVLSTLIGCAVTHDAQRTVALATPSVDIKDLGLYPGIAAAKALSINNEGQVVGECKESGPSPKYHAILWNAGAATLLSVPATKNQFTEATRINDKGQIVGISGMVSVRGDFKAFLWQNDTVTALALPPPNLGASALGINSRGQIVGATGVDYPHRFAVMWERDKVTVLGTLPDGLYSVASAINASGEVVGYGGAVSNSLNAPNHALHWYKGIATDLGVLSAEADAQSRALHINDRGKIVGYSTVPGGKTHAVTWDHGAMIDLGTLPGGTNSRASGINNRGQIVGSSNTGGAAQRAVLWDCGTTIDLGVLPGGTYSGATAINEKGQVVGYGDGAGFVGVNHAILWETNTEGRSCKSERGDDEQNNR